MDTEDPFEADTEGAPEADTKGAPAAETGGSNEADTANLPGTDTSPPKSETHSSGGSSPDWGNRVTSGAVSVVVLAAFLTSAISGLSDKTGALEIVAFADSSGTGTWTLRGSVLSDTGAVSGADVWVTARDAQGNGYASPTATTGPDGSFVIDSIRRTIGANPVTQATIHARHGGGAEGGEESRGMEVVTVTAGGSYRTVAISIAPLILLPTIFLASVLIPFIPGTPRRGRYLASVVFAFAFTVGMVVYITIGLAQVNARDRAGDVLSLGFASIWKGRYVEQADPEWLFSLTSPPATLAAGLARPQGPPPGPTGDEPSPEAGSPASSPSGPADGAQLQATEASEATFPVASGFGAPLWVLLLAVYGAGILTVGIVVRDIVKGLPTSEDEVRQRIGALVEHQFYILFAPLGAIFIYQLLVISEAAGAPVTVAVAALGSGAALNPLFALAVQQAKKAIESRA